MLDHLLLEENSYRKHENVIKDEEFPSELIAFNIDLWEDKIIDKSAQTGNKAKSDSYIF